MTAQTCFTDEITVDGFCGGGGWSTGFELAIGRPVDIGINHDAAAIALHKKNHPYVVEDVTSGDVNKYKYTLNFNPKMWLPEISTIE